MSRNEELLRDAYRQPAGAGQLARMQAFVAAVRPPAARPAPRRWAVPLSVAAAVVAVVAGAVLTVTADRGDNHRNDHPSMSTSTPSPGTSSAATTSTPATTPTAVTTAGPPAAAAGAAVVTATPAFGSANASPVTPFQITVKSVRLQQLSVTASGNTLAGAYSGDRTSWSTAGPLAYGSTYRVSGSALGTDGRVVVVDGTFSTLSPRSQVAVAMSPATGATVGVGQAVSLVFPGGLTPTARAAIEQRLTLASSVPVAGAWGWIRSDDGSWRVDWRPQHIWPANTRVHVQADLFGIELAPGAYGKADAATDFTVGRDHQLTVDGARHLLVVTSSGRTTASYPVSIPTPVASGIFTITERYQTRMSHRPGADPATTSQWALRISDHGEIIQSVLSGAAPDLSINLSTADAKALFDRSSPGDPVRIVNAGAALTPTQDEGNDWAYSWAQWQQLSAR